MSLLWSISPLLTLRRGVSLLVSTLIGVYLGERFSVEQFARMLAQAFCMMITAVSVLYVVAPARLVDEFSSVGALKGLSLTKNAFGGYMAIAVVLLMLVKFRRFRWMRPVFLIAAFAFLVSSRSATSLVVCGVMIAAMPLWRMVQLQEQRRYLVYTTLLTGALLSAYFVWNNSEQVLGVVGRDSTLSGRTQLWSSVTSAIGRHPFLGYGYGAFWAGMKGEALDVWVANKWLSTAADNGYLDLCLGLGLLGLSVFICVLVIAFRRAGEHLRSNKTSMGLWPITYFMFFALHNVCESHLLTTRSLDFLIFAAVSTSLAQYKIRNLSTSDSRPWMPALINYHPQSLPGLSGRPPLERFR
jgi:O-antigen ligase